MDAYSLAVNGSIKDTAVTTFGYFERFMALVQIYGRVAVVAMIGALLKQLRSPRNGEASWTR